jgi:hypothetical protein
LRRPGASARPWDSLALGPPLAASALSRGGTAATEDLVSIGVIVLVAIGALLLFGALLLD